MEESFKDLVIVILTFVLLYLIFNKLIRSDKANKTTNPNKLVKSLYPYPTKPTTTHMHPNVTHMHPNVNHIQHTTTNIHPNVDHMKVPVKNFKESCSSDELLSINSNGLSNDNVASNMSDHELIHIDNSKPYICNEEIPINNIPELNAVQLQERFNYVKEFDEENFDYYDPIGLY